MKVKDHNLIYLSVGTSLLTNFIQASKSVFCYHFENNGSIHEEFFLPEEIRILQKTLLAKKEHEFEVSELIVQLNSLSLNDRETELLKQILLKIQNYTLCKTTLFFDNSTHNSTITGIQNLKITFDKGNDYKECLDYAFQKLHLGIKRDTAVFPFLYYRHALKVGNDNYTTISDTSAEIQTLVAYLIKHEEDNNGLKENIVLVPTDTPDCQFAALAIKYFFQKLKGKNANHLFKNEDIQIVEISGLQLGDFRKGAENLFLHFRKEISSNTAKNKNVFIISGGYKGSIVYITMFCQYTGTQIVYQNEKSDVLIEIEPLLFDMRNLILHADLLSKVEVKIKSITYTILQEYKMLITKGLFELEDKIIKRTGFGAYVSTFLEESTNQQKILLGGMMGGLIHAAFCLENRKTRAYAHVLAGERFFPADHGIINDNILGESVELDLMGTNYDENNVERMDMIGEIKSFNAIFTLDTSKSIEEIDKKIKQFLKHFKICKAKSLRKYILVFYGSAATDWTSLNDKFLYLKTRLNGFSANTVLEIYTLNVPFNFNPDKSDSPYKILFTSKLVINQEPKKDELLLKKVKI